MKKSILVITFIISVIASSYIVYKLYPSVHPLGALKLNYNKAEAKQKADSLISSLDLSTENKSERTFLQINNKLTHTLYNEYSYSETNELLREKIPGYYWEVEWKNPDKDVVISSDENKKEIISKGDISIDLDTKGNLLSFKREMLDSIKFPSIKPDEARELAINFIKKYSPVKVNDSTNSSNRFAVKGSFKESDVQETVKQGRTDYKFSWRGKSAVINKDIIVSARSIRECSFRV